MESRLLTHPHLALFLKGDKEAIIIKYMGSKYTAHQEKTNVKSIPHSLVHVQIG